MPTIPDSTYDTVIVGAGIAGLIAACTLAQGGANVCVLEANHQPGGLMAGIWRKGFYFDVGDQSFEHGNILFALLKNLGVYDDLHFLRAWYRFKAPNIDSIIRGPDDLPAAFTAAFPEDAAQTAAFFADLHRDLRPLEPLLHEDHNPLLHNGAAATMAAFRLGTRLALNAPRLLRLNRIRGSERAAEFYAPDSRALDFFKHMGYKNMSEFVWLGFMHSWWHDYWYPVGGLQALADRLAARLIELGGHIFYKRAVGKIVTEDQRSGRGLRAVGVETTKGDQIRAEYVVHAGDMKSLYHGLLPDYRGIRAWRDRILHGSLSEALTSVYLGVNLPPQILRDCLQAHHTFYFRNFNIHDPHTMDDPDLHARAWVEVSAPMVDPENDQFAPPGHSTIVIQTMVRAGWNQRWQMAGAADKHGYRDLKQHVIDQMIGTLNDLIPGIGKHVVYSEVGSALSAERFTHNTGGTTAGWTFDPHASPLRNRLIAVRTPVDHLLTAGHYAMWPGSVPTAALTGKLAADRILGKPLGRLLHAVEGVLPMPAYPPAGDPGITDLPGGDPQPTDQDE